MKARTVTFFGNFGTRNLGNEFTLQAILQNARKYLPAANVNCVCTDAEVTSADHGIPAFPMSYRFRRLFTSPPLRGHHNRMVKLARRLVIRLPLEILEWVKAFRILSGTSMLVMTGTGMLCDYGIGPLDLHYEILKWSIIAKLRRCKLLFVSVGAGPIAHPLSRWIVKSALSLADYRSYRDEFSRQFLESIGFNTAKDFVYPDLVFSLETPWRLISPDRPGHGCVVGLGLMDYYGDRRSPEDRGRVYDGYLRRVSRFAAWLLDHRYSVRLLIGDLSYDTRVRDDLVRILEESGSKLDPGRVFEQPLASGEQLHAELSQTDVVVATRFHNVLVSLMLNRPVIALSYHDKVRSLMASVGLAEYCQDIAELDVDRLIGQFMRLQQDAETIRSSLKEKTEEFRRALDEQYERIFVDPETESRQESARRSTRTDRGRRRREPALSVRDSSNGY
jgi:polysaccharide pyruvyl transferase WcaK-like protein